VLGGGLTVSSTLDAGAYTITPGASSNVTVSGTLKTANTAGFSGSTSTAISNANNPSYTLTGSTIEYTASVAQTVSSRSDYNNLTVSGGSTKTMAATVTVGGALKLSSTSDKLSIGTDTLKLNGTIDGASVGFITGGTGSNLIIGSTTTVGTLLFDQTTATTSTLKNMTLNGSGSTTTVGNSLNLTGILTPTLGTLSSGGYLTLRSTSITATAIVAQGSGTVTGNVTVERFIPQYATINGTGSKAFRDISPGVVMTDNMFTGWQESGVNTNGYGTQITGKKGTPGQTDNTTGLDYTISGNNSLYSYNINASNGAASWDAITTTKGTIASPFKGYRISLRGNRANNLGTDVPYMTSTITLRPKGQLIFGDVVYGAGAGVTANSTTYTATTNGTSGIGIRLGYDTSNAFTMIGNPYVCPIDWVSIMGNSYNSTKIQAACYIWDPNVGTSGAYVTYNYLTGSSNASGSQVNQYIQPGQAFFIQSNNTTSPQFQIRDQDKVAVQDATRLRNVFGSTAPLSKISISLLKNANSKMVNMDGTVMCYRSDFGTAIGREDAEKIDNNSDCIAISSQGSLYSIEGRPQASATDSFFLKLYYTTANVNYQLQVDLSAFTANGLQPYLRDRFTKTTTALALGSTTVYGFTTTSDTNSYNRRFTVYFTGAAPLPLSFTAIKATANSNNSNAIEWTANETHVDYYEVEYSNDAQHFTVIGKTVANGNGLNSYSYQHYYNNNGNNWYRIKGVDKSGAVTYSAVVMVSNGSQLATIRIFPNPIQNGIVNLVFDHMTDNTYDIGVYTLEGKLLQQGSIKHTGTTGSYRIILPPQTPTGTYQLKVSKGATLVQQQLLLVH
jgi:hypothetical protein